MDGISERLIALGNALECAGKWYSIAEYPILYGIGEVYRGPGIHRE
jgi:hypothetical protein